jgi:hypothetical protein
LNHQWLLFGPPFLGPILAQADHLPTIPIHARPTRSFDCGDELAEGAEMEERRLATARSAGRFEFAAAFPQLGFVQLVNASSHASYHSLQVRLQQRLARGFTLLSSFSFEKSI